MGARLAAHCANHGLTVHLLDVSEEKARQGLEAARQSRPAAFFLPELAGEVATGSFADGAAEIRQADWVVEAIVEDLEAKRALLGRVAGWLGRETVLSSNTSGLPIREVGAELAREVRQRWLGTHFFNPPRYMRLVEIIPGPDCDRDAAKWLAGQIELRLGKGIVWAKDTPNFIANRIGIFALLHTLRLMRQHGLSVEDVDALTGPVMGWPKSATFRTLDMIGLDTLAQVVRNSKTNLPHDEAREMFVVPDYVETMLERGWLGEKSGKGFYQRQGDEILALDLDTLTYRPRRKPARRYLSLAEALQGSAFVRECLAGIVTYSEARLGEISDDPEDVNRAMRWGYNWQWGPFELRQILREGKAPERRFGTRVQGNAGCSLLDLGDGVGCLEFHSKMNTIGGDAVELVSETLADRHARFEGFVIYNGAENFSAGADLLYLLAMIQNEDWDDVEEAVRRFQAMNMAVKRSARPVVVAPFGLTLGGGCELMLHSAQTVAHAELYTGLVEVGVGLIPAGGGTKEMALRTDPRTALEGIARGKISGSAAEARQLHYLRQGDAVIANREMLLEGAKRAALQLAASGHEPPRPARLRAPGPSVASTLRLGAYLMREAEQISEHDLKIAEKLIHVLCAGGAPQGMEIAEEELLDLEREEFLSLCGERKTQDRIAHMLKTGKALRN